MTSNQPEPIIKNGTRILRPIEFKKLCDAIPKSENLDKLEALLFTGMRYKELQRLYKNRSNFKGNTIYVASGKKKAIYGDRYIRLNKQGERAVRYFLRCKTNLPTYKSWQYNLRRWCKEAGISSEGMNNKTTRKTWESWLVQKYQKQIELIFLSQGHSQLTALKYYLMIPFTKKDIEDMDYYTEGWI